MRPLLLSAIFASLAVLGFAKEGKKGAHKIIEATPETLNWTAAPSGLPAGAQAVVLEGDPGKPGYFALRLKVPAGYKVMPHTHPTEERITVIEGTLSLGMGRTWDDSALKEYPVGSYVSMPKGHEHFAFFKDAGVIQLSSIGPWGITYVDPKDDPRRATKGR